MGNAGFISSTVSGVFQGLMLHLWAQRPDGSLYREPENSSFRDSASGFARSGFSVADKADASETSITLLGGSWVVISRVVSRVTIAINYSIRGLITPLITTHEPPSTTDFSGTGSSRNRTRTSITAYSIVVSRICLGSRFNRRSSLQRPPEECSQNKARMCRQSDVRVYIDPGNGAHRSTSTCFPAVSSRLPGSPMSPSNS